MATVEVVVDVPAELEVTLEVTGGRAEDEGVAPEDEGVAMLPYNAERNTGEQVELFAAN